MKKTLFLTLLLACSPVFAQNFCSQTMNFCVDIPKDFENYQIVKDKDGVMVFNQPKQKEDTIGIKIFGEKLAKGMTAKETLDEAYNFQNGMSDIISETQTDTSYKVKGQYVPEMFYQRFIQIKNGRVIEFYGIYPVAKAKEIEPKIQQMQNSLILK